MLRGIGDVLVSADGDHHAYLLAEWVQFKLTNGRGGEPATLMRFRTFTDVVGCGSFVGWTPSAFQLVLATGTTDLSRGVHGMGFASRVKLFNELRIAPNAPSDDAPLRRLYLDKLDALNLKKGDAPVPAWRAQMTPALLSFQQPIGYLPKGLRLGTADGVSVRRDVARAQLDADDGAKEKLAS